MTAPAHLNHARGYIGGGNAAGILGISPFKTPLDEFFVITGQAPPPPAEREAFFRRRKALEPFAAEAFQQATGVAIVARNNSYTDTQHDFIRAELDFETEDGWSGETKTVHSLAARDWGPSGTDEAPLYVIAQAMHGLMVTGKPGAWIHALVGLDDDRIYRIERDEDAIEAIRESEVAFWHNHIVPLVQPEPTTREDVLALFPRDTGRTVVGDVDAIMDAIRLQELKKQIKEREVEHDEVAQRLQLYMRDAAILTDAGGKPLITWKAQSSNRFSEKEFAAAHPDLYEAFKRVKDIRVMRCK